MANYLHMMSRVRTAAFRYLEIAMRESGIEDLPPSYGDVVFVIGKRGPLEIGEVGRLVGKDKSTVTSVVNDLVKKGYVEKTRDDEDRRRVRVTLTDKARRAQGELFRISKTFNRRFLKGFTDQEQKQLADFMERLLENAEG